MALLLGDKLGPYEIIAPIGKGGMGEVWKARDPRVGRDVAIKVSQEHFSERFEHEAKAIGALNHPNICTLYDVGPNYLVMEYVDGTPIAPVDSPRKLLDLAVQIADGMAAAHAAGFTHRDLKPDNVLVTGPQTPHPGRVKILDFGLAKRAGVTAQSDATQTIAAATTNPGTVLGTVFYMSPEQARGEEVDARSDQFSFGLIVYELAAHKRAFVRASAAETMTAIIRDEADPLLSSVPAPLRWVVERCLAKDPAERYDSTRDLYRELKLARERLSEGSVSGSQPAIAVAPPTARRPRWRVWAVAALAALAGFGAALFWPTPAPEPPRPAPFATEFDLQTSPRWSPTGDRIAYVAAVDGVFQVFAKKLDAVAPTQITHEPVSCSQPSWSGDGTRIYFIEGLFPAMSVRSIAVAGGPSQLVRDKTIAAELTPDGRTLAMLLQDEAGKYRLAFASPPEAPPQFYTRGKFTTLFGGNETSMHIHPSGKFMGLIFAGNEFWKVPLGGEPELVRGLQGIDDFAFWNDERHILALHAINPSDSELSVVDLDTGSSRRVFSVGNQSTPAVSHDGRILAVPLMERGYDVIEVPLDGSPPRDVIATPRDEVAPSWSPDGSRFAYVTNRSGVDQLWLRNRSQGLEQLIAGPKDFPGVPSPVFLDSAISPDGTRVAYRMETGRDYSIWISALSGDTPVRLWNDPAQIQRGAAWSPDGAWIAYYSARDGRNAIFKARVGGNAAPELVAYTSEPQPVRWSPDGAWIAYRDGKELRIVSPDGQQKRVVNGRRWETYGWSKDSTALYGIAIDEQRHHILARIDVAAARETKIADYGLTGGAVDFAYVLGDFPYRGFSLHPEGKSFLTSVYRAKSQIYLLRDFNRPVRLIDRWLGK